MKRSHVSPLCLVTLATLMGLAGCQPAPSGNCIVKGTVQGVRNGTRLELQDKWDDFKVVGTGRVRNGTFEIHPETSGPAHVYLYVHNGPQLKDFLLEPGTILVEADAIDESTLFLGATGTPANDLFHRINVLENSGQKETAYALMDSILAEKQADPLALRVADHHCKSASQYLKVLDKLTPELAAMPYVAQLRDDLTRRIQTEPRAEGGDFVPVYIDMEYPDVQGNPVKLSDVVNDPANRYVLLDFWATWCGPCREAVPKLRDIYAKYHGKGLEIYSVSVDVSKNEKKWKQFIEENKMDWIHVLEGQGSGKKSAMTEAYALDGYPTLLLIDGSSGEILARDHHLDLDALLANLLP